MSSNVSWPLWPTQPPKREPSAVDEQAETLLYQLIGERVRARRGSVTQTDLADRVGIGRTSITNLELGQQRMPLHYLTRIAEALDCDVRELLPTREELMDGGTKVVLGVSGELPSKAKTLIDSYLAKEHSASLKGAKGDPA